MKIEVGMKLHVRADLNVGMSVRYGVNEEMEKLADKEVTVSGVFGNEIKIQEDKGRFSWSGETVVPDSFDEDRWNECSNGIHFFITKQEAIDY